MSPPSSPSRLTTAGGLALVACLLPAPSQAVIIDSGPINLSVPQDINGVYLNFVTGQTGPSAASVPGWDFNPFQANGVLVFFWPTTNSGGVASAPGVFASLSFSGISMVGPGSDFTVGSFTTPASTVNFQTVGTEILGFRFFNESTGAVNFGYAYFETGSSSGFPATISRYVYENTGSAIGLPVPEPGTMSLLAAFAGGALGVRAWRSRSARPSDPAPAE